MKFNKKLGTLGIITLTIITGFTNIQKASSQTNDNPRFVQIQYFSQIQGMYCGQATTEMVLYAAQGVRVRQNILTREMNYTQEKGTKNTNMIKPFENRNATIVSIGEHKTQVYLRKNVANGYYTIINIRFSENSNTGHYVVVTGYNRTGFFVHDPWPDKWSTPEGRETGEYAYISSELLQELWSFRDNWALTVARTGTVVVSPETGGSE